MTAKLTTEQILARFYLATNGDDWKRNDNWMTDKPLDHWYGIVTNREGEVTQIILAGNNLTGAIPIILGQMKKLTNLNLAGNRLTGSIPAAIGGLEELRGLNLSNNLLTGPVPQKLRELRLYTASISNNMLSDRPGFNMYVGTYSNMMWIQVQSRRNKALDPETSTIFNLTMLRKVLAKAEQDLLQMVHESQDSSLEKIQEEWNKVKAEKYPGLVEWNIELCTAFCRWCRTIINDPQDTSCKECEMAFDMRKKDEWTFLDSNRTARKKDKHSYQATWSQEKDKFVGVCPDFPGISCPANTAEEAYVGIRRMVKAATS